MRIDVIVTIIVSLFVLYASFKLEREDMGCESCFSPNVDVCSDYNSVYVRGTRCLRGDSQYQIKKKLKKLLSFDERAGCWKRCVLWGFLLASLGYVIYAKSGSIDDSNINKTWLFVISWIVFTSVLYGMKSFESSHIFRIIKENGHKLVDMMHIVKN